MPSTLRAILQALQRPVHPENRRHLGQLWERLPPALRGERQMIGRQAEGCGATSGAQPRCDFACTGCYLGAGANRVPAAPLEELERQLAVLRVELGRWGNLQITDGEVTLRDERELIELVRRARAHELEPMLMTHGDTFRRRPGLLERLVVEGGLRELSLHVDTTQRGRRGSGWDEATREEQLHPLRDELAECVRDVRRSTGIALRVATTVSVTPGNLCGVSEVLRWARRNPDVVRIVSFQPLAQVGRTEDGLGGRVDAHSLWRQIALGLLDDEDAHERLEDARLWFGHPDCSRVVMGVLAREGPGPARYLPAHRFSDAREAAAWRAWLGRWGGLSFRADGRAEALARACGVALRSLDLGVRHAPALLRAWLERLDADHPGRGLARLLTGRTRLSGLAVLSHHFMERAELETPLGRERVAACSFRVEHEGRSVSMCEFNALGLRDEQYARLAEQRVKGSSITQAVPSEELEEVRP